MSHGSTFELLYTAHRKQHTALLQVDDARIWLRDGVVVYAQGVPWSSLDPEPGDSLETLLKRWERQDGDLNLARALASSDIGVFCARHANRPARLELGSCVRETPWRLHAPVLTLMARGLRAQRSADTVYQSLHPVRHQPLELEIPSQAHLRGLDRRTRLLLTQLGILRTPAMLLSVLAAGYPTRARDLLLRLDLLLHLGLVRLPRQLPLPSAQSTADLDTVHAAALRPSTQELDSLLERARSEGAWVLLDIAALDLDQPLRRADLAQALEAGVQRLRNSPWAHLPQIRALRKLLVESRPVLDSTEALAVWVRSLRRAGGIDAPVGARQRRQAPLHLDMARTLRHEGRWSAALQQISRSLELDPSAEVNRIDQVLCLVALKRMGVRDALLNLQALRLPNAEDQARAERAARRLRLALPRAERSPHRGSLSG
ncbi:MAG: hypothetical protein VX899_22660 [Myxococcota bacterium]|nr:hypothetical protein [Myxococcota bacterium]